MDDPTTSAFMAWLERIEGKVDSISDTQSTMNTDMAVVKTDLAYHIRRTDILEEEIKTRASKTQVATLQEEVRPVVIHVNRIKWAVGASIFLVTTYKLLQSAGIVP